VSALPLTDPQSFGPHLQTRRRVDIGEQFDVVTEVDAVRYHDIAARRERVRYLGGGGAAARAGWAIYLLFWKHLKKNARVGIPVRINVPVFPQDQRS
jgi:hypothetical protein